MIEALARLLLPRAAVDVLDVVERIPAAVTAARTAWDAGHGPIVALRELAAATEGELDDAAVEQLEVALRRALAALDTTCAAGAWLSATEPEIRGVLDRGLAALFGAAYRASAGRDTLRRWRDQSQVE